MKDKIKIRAATVENADLLSKLSRKTFSDAFADNPHNQAEDFAAYMAQAFNAEQLKRELADPRAVFLIADVEGEIAGYAKLLTDSREPDITADKPIEIVRLYAHQKFIGKGIGAALMQRCLNEAANRGHDVIWLGVWEHNPEAQKFYRKWNFVPVGSHVFQLGADAQTDVLMARAVGAD